jgi:hypothetical protein
VEANLSRIPGEHDPAAHALLTRIPRPVAASDLAPLSPEVRHWLDCYGCRQVTIALRQSSRDLLHEALLASALADCLGWMHTPNTMDDRDAMIGLALPWVVAQQIGIAPADLFTAVADLIPEARVAQLLRRFGSRQDITAEAFCWRRITTPDGPDFAPVPW